MDESGFRHHYTPTNEMMKNLEKIFKFYALLHMPIHTSHKLTFDQINHQNKIVSLSEFYKFYPLFLSQIIRLLYKNKK